MAIPLQINVLVMTMQSRQTSKSTEPFACGPSTCRRHLRGPPGDVRMLPGQAYRAHPTTRASNGWIMGRPPEPGQSTWTHLCAGNISRRSPAMEMVLP